MIQHLAPHLQPCRLCGEPCTDGVNYSNGFGPCCSIKHAYDYAHGVEPTYKPSNKCRVTSREALHPTPFG